jgi:tryptophanyl-tRNA synthetase
LLDVYSAMSGEPVSDIEAAYEGKGYGDLKKDLAEVVVEGLGPVRDRAHELLDDPAELDHLLESGARRAQDVALPNLESARAKLGLD